MNILRVSSRKKRHYSRQELSSENIGFSSFSDNYHTDGKNQLTHQKKIVRIDIKGKMSEILPEQLKKRKGSKTRLNLIDLNIGFYIITPILLGVLIGFGMDNWFDKKPFFVSWGIILGTIASFYNLISFLRKDG